MTETNAHAVTLLAGDWIGPETCDVMRAVLAAAGVNIDWDEPAWDPEVGLTDEIVDSCRRTGRVVKAKLKVRRTVGVLPPTVELRKRLGLWAAIRPVKALPNCGARYPDIDLVVIRETSEDIYSGLEHEVADGVYEAVKVTTRAACERIARFAYDYARAHGRKKVSIVHKANIMKMSDGMFLRTAEAIGKEYPDIETEEVIVDALCMRLVRGPEVFDVLLAGNLFGDIVSDLASGLAGGITAAPSESVGDGVHIFENPHGKAADLVGTGRANPIPMLRTALRLLRNLKEHDAADRIIAAIRAALTDGLLTCERGGDADRVAVQREIITRL